MGNNNSTLPNDKTEKDDIQQKNTRKYNKISKKSSTRNTPERSTPERRHSIVDDHSPEQSISEPLENKLLIRHRFGSFGNRKISPTQQIFLDNVILPLGNEINTRISKTKKLEKIIEDKKRNQKLDDKQSNEVHPKHYRAPAGLSTELSRLNIAALIAGTDEKTDHKKYPVVFEYTGAGDKVFLSGCFNDWEKIEMSKNKRPNDFISVIDLKQGHYEYQYIIHHPPTIKENSSTYSPFQTPKSLRNRKKLKDQPRIEIGPKKKLTVKKEDYNVFQALDMDSFVVANSRRRISCATTDDESEAEDKRKPRSCCAQDRCTPSCMAPKAYGQKIPNFTKQRHYSKNPPIIPPHLLHYMLNKKTKRQINTCSHRMLSGNSVYPAINYEILLPKPCHTLLNHLYAESIKDDVMTLSTTQRYREKYVTTVFYRPIG